MTITSIKNHINRVCGIVGSAVAALLLAACGDFLEEYSQDTDYVRSWKDLDELLIGDCYMPVNDSRSFYYQSNYGMFIHLLTDEVEEQVSGFSQVFDSHERSFGYYTWQQRLGQNENYSGFNPENALWTKVYKQINIANNILNKANGLPQNTNSEKQGLLKVKGEAHFLRGYYYFFLVNLYGPAYNPATAGTDLGVPIKTTQEVVDIKFDRQTVQEVYDLVVSDLLTAEELLSQVTGEKKSIYRADATAVRLLLSRVYLYMQQWQNAAEYARKTISDHPRLQDLNYNKSRMMEKANVENIFSMGGDDLICMIAYGAKGLRISSEQYTCYSGNDLRRTLWFWKYSDFQGTTLWTFKHRLTEEPLPTEAHYYYYTTVNAYEGSKAEVSSLFWLRSAEAYLNLAEAEACQGNEAAACKALNTLRKARIMNTTSAAEISSTGEQLVTDIRNERRREFVMQGQRWFDLRRYRVCQVYPQKKSITHDYTYYVERNSTQKTETHRFVLTEDDLSWTLPIPQEVLDFNTGMKNNGNQWRDFTVL